MISNPNTIFQVDDIVLDISKRWFQFSELGNRVQAVSPDWTQIRIDGEWIASDTFRWIGSIPIYNERIAYQRKFISRLMSREFYSMERKREVVDSAILILNRFLQYMKHHQVSTAQDLTLKKGSKVGAFFEADQEYHQGVCISDVAKRGDGVEVITVDWGESHGTERVDMLTLLE